MTLVRGLGILALVVGVAALSVTGTLWLTDSDPGHVANSIITAAAALAVAFLTIVTTDRRQNSQLAHDAERHLETLEAESQRETARLAHDRHARELEEARKLIDNFSDVMTRLQDALDAARVFARSAADPSETDEELPPAEELVPRARAGYKEFLDFALEARKWPMLFRVRFGEGHPMSVAVALFFVAANDDEEDVGSTREEIESGALANALTKLTTKVTEAERVVVKAAHEQTGLRLET
jgi:hypothetical protein